LYNFYFHTIFALPFDERRQCIFCTAFKSLKVCAIEFVASTIHSFNGSTTNLRPILAALFKNVHFFHISDHFSESSSDRNVFEHFGVMLHFYKFAS